METPVCIYADSSGKNGSSDKTSPMRAPGREGGHLREKLEMLTSAEPSGSHPKTEARCPIPLRRFTPSGRVTSVDLTPDGAYVIAGCSDGTLRLYSMLHPSWGSEGLLLGQIHAKGLITNLIFHVEVADDGRFAFAGVLRGSVEMFAYDLTRLPRGHFGEGLDTGGDDNEDVNLSKAAAELLIECHTNLDAKLRGFGAVTRVATTRAASGLGAWEMESEAEPPEYRLICGLGIKNLHIWRFQQGSQVECSAPTWECIFDLASNGMSIELLTVRAGGLEAVSKSCGQNLRVWDLSSLDKKDRAPYTDILNTQDIRAVCGDYAFGGTCQLSLVRLDACCELNRMELPLPTTASSKALSGGKTKRRQLCSVKDVVGTHGEGTQGGRVLVVCSDGGVHCYENTGATSATGKLVPVHSLTTEVDEDVSFSLALVGSPEMATPVVMQTRWLADENCGEITVEPLRLDQAMEEAVAVRRRALGQLEPNKVGRQGCREGDAGVAKGKGPSKGHSRGSIGNCPLMSPVDALAPKLQNGASTVTPCRGNNPRGALSQGPAPASGKKPATKKRAKSLPSHGGHASEKPSIEDFKVGMAVKDASETSTSVASSGLVAIKSSVPMRRSALVAPPLAHSRAAAASVRAPPLAGVQPHHPLKRRHYDPFAAVTRSKRGKNAYEGPSKAMRDLEAKRAAEEAGSKTQDFFLERVAREDILREMRIASVLEARRERILATTSGGWDEQTPSFVEAGPFSTVTTWGDLREKHRRDTENLRLNFKAEHDRLRSRFLEAVERERLMFHIQKHALPSCVRDPLGFLWWHSSRLPIKKQWGRYRAFPQQSLEVMALTGQPDVANRRFSLSGVIASFKAQVARTLRRQQVEADTLAAVQCMDLPFIRPSPIQVSYPYVDDFAIQDPVGQHLKLVEKDDDAANVKLVEKDDDAANVLPDANTTHASPAKVNGENVARDPASVTPFVTT